MDQTHIISETENPRNATDDEAFVKLLAKHEPNIRAFIRVSFPDANHVTEVMQNVSLIAWKKFSTLENPTSDFARWACVIARYEIMKFRRTLARDRFILDEDLIESLCIEGEAETAQRSEMIHHLADCLQQLPAERRTLVLEAYTPNTSIKSMAENIGKNPDALYQLLKRIRQKLEQCILRNLESEKSRI